jgi:hypothetical protein
VAIAAAGSGATVLAQARAQLGARAGEAASARAGATATADTVARSQAVASLQTVLLRIRGDFRQLKRSAKTLDPAATDFNPQSLGPIAGAIEAVSADLDAVAVGLGATRLAPVFEPPHRDLAAAAEQLQAAATALRATVTDLQTAGSGQATNDLARARDDLHACNRSLKLAKSLLDTLAQAG